MTRIRIIDDDVELSGDLAARLRKEGFQVSTSDDLNTAIDELVKDKPDVLVLDVMFPENPVGGFDLARKIRRNKELANLPVILLTSMNQLFPMDFSADDIDPDWMPVQDFLDKPVDLQVLLRKIRKMLKTSGK